MHPETLAASIRRDVHGANHSRVTLLFYLNVALAKLVSGLIVQHPAQ